MSEEYGMIKRAKRPDTGYLWVLNSVARDQRVSRRARGLLIEMLSYPDDWDFDRDWLAAQSDHEGQHAVRNALAELEKFGYLERRRVRLPGGRFGWEHTLYDAPRDIPPVQTSGQKAPSGAGQHSDVYPGRTTGRFSTDGAPTDGVPTGGKRPSYEGLSTDNCYEEEQPLASLAPPNRAEALPGMPERPPAPRRAASPARPPVDEMFEIFWQTYPRREGKQAARKLWSRAVKGGVPAAKIIEGAERYARDPNREPQYTAHPSTWLNQGRWDDEPLPPRNGRPTGGASRLSVAMDAVRQLQEEERGEGLALPPGRPTASWPVSAAGLDDTGGYRL